MIVGYVSGTGALHRAHPFTALAMAAATVVLAVVLPGPVGPVAVVAALIMVALGARLHAVLASAAVLIAPFWAFLIVIHVIIGHTPARVLGVGLPITAIVLGFLLALAAVHPARLVDALLQHRVPFAAAYLLSATLQAVPRLRDRAAAILDAQRCRGLRVRGSVWTRARAVVPLAIPLVLGALAEVDERAVALEVRGATSGQRRTPLAPPPDRAIERFIRWLLLTMSIGAVIVRIVT